MGQLKKTAPSYLGTTASATWRRIVPFLNAHADVIDVDSNLVELFCTQYEIYRNSYESIKTLGATYAVTNVKQSSKGEQLGEEIVYKRNPATQVASDASNQMMKIAASFGLTPKARQQLFKEADGGINSSIDPKVSNLSQFTG